MTTCKSATTPFDTSPKLSAFAGPLVADPTEYQSLSGALQYLDGAVMMVPENLLACSK
jgi:hypothetical protein